MTTTYTVEMFEINAELDSTNTYDVSFTWDDSVTSVSYSNDFFDGSFFPDVTFTPFPVSIEVDGVDVNAAFDATFASAVVGTLNWSGGSTVMLGLFLEGSTEAGDLDLVAQVGGAALPAGADDSVGAFLSFLFNDLGITDPDDIPPGTFAVADGAFGPGADIPLSSISWDSVVDNDTSFNGTPNADTITFATDETDDKEINGLGGNDILGGAAGNDTITGGFGFDTIRGEGGDDSLFGNENSDQLFGNGGNDYMEGGGGADRLEGGDGDDDLRGGSGADRLEGDAGNDLLYLGSNFGGSKDGGNGGTGNDTIYGEAGFDILLGGDGDDSLFGGNQADNLFGNNDNDYLDGGNGKDRLFGANGDDTIFGGNGNDLFSGGFGNDEIYGEEGDDNIFSGAGNDVVDGGTGNDQVRGQDGDDTLTGGEGQDTLTGGAGDDDFVFASGHGNDTISDFETGVDLIDLTAFGFAFTDFGFGDASSGIMQSDGSGNTIITTETGSQIFINGFNGDISSGDFII